MLLASGVAELTDYNKRTMYLLHCLPCIGDCIGELLGILVIEASGIQQQVAQGSLEYPLDVVTVVLIDGAEHGPLQSCDAVPIRKKSCREFVEGEWDLHRSRWPEMWISAQHPALKAQVSMAT